jgi:hypothetical protein
MRHSSANACRTTVQYWQNLSFTKQSSLSVDKTVLRIRDVYPGSLPDPGSRTKRSWIQTRIKELKYFFLPRNLFLSIRKNDLGCSSRIQGSKKHLIRILDPGSGSATLVKKMQNLSCVCQNLSFFRLTCLSLAEACSTVTMVPNQPIFHNAHLLFIGQTCHVLSDIFPRIKNVFSVAVPVSNNLFLFQLYSNHSDLT